MKKIEKFEEARERKASFEETKINPTMFRAYTKSLKLDYDLINFEDVIWENDVEPIVNSCRELNITMITITCEQSSMIKILSLFDKLGCKILGMTELKTQYYDWDKDDNKIPKYEPALIIKI